MPWVFDKSIICPTDTKSLKRYRQYKRYYKVKYDIAKKYNPSTILEIGVRAGYSAYSFLSACPKARYVGIDAENGEHGGQDGPWIWWAEEILKNFDVKFEVADSQQLTKINGNYDMIHIDGDHTTEGLLHDLEICWPAVNDRGIMLVDDYDYIDTVKKGVDMFAKRPGVRKEYLKSLRGEIVFSK